MSQSYQCGDIVRVLVKKIIPNGLGLCFAEDLTLLVPLAVEGDELQVEIRKLKGKTAFARIVEVIEPAPERVDPPCRYFGECGGCDFQQMSYPAQLAAKKEIIRDSFWRIGKITLPAEPRMVPSPREFGYRLRTQIHAERDRRRMGFFKRQSHEVVGFDSCRVLVPELDECVNRVKSGFPWEGLEAERSDLELTAFGEQTSCYSRDVLPDASEVRFRAGGFEYYFDATVFFQANGFLIGELVEAVTGGLSGESALDLYSGVGLFSLPLAAAYAAVDAVESNGRAIGFARRSAREAGLSNISFHHSRVRDFVRANRQSPADLVLLDPPRSGVGLKLLERIAEIARSAIVYVSCNPSTMARDLRILVDKGFEIEDSTLLDLFPQTHHIESVVRMRRRI